MLNNNQRIDQLTEQFQKELQSVLLNYQKGQNTKRQELLALQKRKFASIEQEIVNQAKKMKKTYEEFSEEILRQEKELSRLLTKFKESHSEFQSEFAKTTQITESETTDIQVLIQVKLEQLKEGMKTLLKVNYSKTVNSWI